MKQPIATITASTPDWGRTISIKFFLNKRLKFRLIDGQKKYPVYARVICKKQRCDFRIPEAAFSQKEIDLISIDKPDLKIKFHAAELDGIKEDIKLILELLHPFDRSNFSLKRFPEIYQLFYKALQTVVDEVFAEELKKEMDRNGYTPLLDLIDWTKRDILDKLEAALWKLQSKKLIKNFPLYSIRERFFFLDAVRYLVPVALNKTLFPDTEKKLSEFADELVRKKIIRTEERATAIRVIKSAAEFTRAAISLSSK